MHRHTPIHSALRRSTALLCARALTRMRRRHASSSGKLRWHPSGTVRATPAVIRFSRSINPICTASLTKPPSELKKIGRSRFAKTAKNSRNRWAAPLSNLPSPVIHSVQPRPQAFGSPAAITKISGSLWIFASMRSSSLGSSLAAIATTGRQQSAAGRPSTAPTARAGARSRPPRHRRAPSLAPARSPPREPEGMRR